MVSFKQFLNEAGEEEFLKVLEEVQALIDASVGGQMIWVKQEGETYFIVEIVGEDFIESKLIGSEKEVYKTSKLYKDGNILNYDLGISRLLSIKKAIKNKQLIKSKEEE